MSIPQHIRDTKTDILYHLTKYVDSGATAAVYEAEADPASVRLIPTTDDNLGRRVAVKLPLDSKWAPAFEEELEHLEMIRAAAGGKYCVVAHKGEDPSNPDLPTIIMEMLPREWWVFNLTRDRVLDEIDALELVRQYTDLLRILHDTLGLTSGDRKGSDLYWDPISKRLIVLDWNVITKRPRSFATEEERTQDQERVRADIVLLAQIWYELVVGYPAKGVVDADKAPVSGAQRWLALSRGTRHLLARALSSRQGYAFGRATELLSAIERHKQLLLEGQPGPLLAQAERIRATDTLGGAEDLPRIEEVADLIDLVGRKSPTMEQQQQIIRLQEWVSDFQKRSEDRLRARIERAKQDILEGAYSEAMNQLSSLEEMPTALELESQRWLVLARALVEGQKYQVSLREVRPVLAAMIDNLNSGKYNEAIQVINTETRKQPLAEVPAACGMLQLIETEISVRDLYERARQFTNQASSAVGVISSNAQEQAHTAFLRAGDALEVLTQQPRYQGAIFADLPALQVGVEMARREAGKRAAQQQAEEVARQAEQDIASMLRACLAEKGAKPVWPDSLKRVISMLAVSGTDRIGRLAKLDQLVTDGRIVLALDAASALAEDYPDWESARLTNDLCRRIADEQIKELATSARTPSRIQEGLTLYKRLGSEISRSTHLHEPLGGQLSNYGKQLGERYDLLQQIFRRLNNPPNPLANLEDVEIDELLARAANNGIDLADTSVFPGQMSAGTLLQIRTSQRICQRANEIRSNIEEMAKDLIGRTAELHDVNNKLSDLVTKRDELYAMFGQAGLQVEQLQELSRRLAEVQEQSALISNGLRSKAELSTYDQEISWLENQLEGLSATLDTVQDQLTLLQKRKDNLRAQTTDILATSEVLEPLILSIRERLLGDLTGQGTMPLREVIEEVIRSRLTQQEASANEYFEEIKQLANKQDPAHLEQIELRLNLIEEIPSTTMRTVVQYNHWKRWWLAKKQLLGKINELVHAYQVIKANLQARRYMPNDVERLLKATEDLLETQPSTDTPHQLYWQPLYDEIDDVYRIGQRSWGQANWFCERLSSVEAYMRSRFGVVRSRV